MKKLIIAFRYFKYKIFSRFYHLGWKVIFEKNVILRGTKYMKIGNHVNFDANSVIYVVKHPKYDTKKPRLIIEDEVGIGIGAVILTVNSIHIKKCAMIGPHTVIADYDHRYQDANVSIKNQGLINIKPVIIEEGAWIGANVTVCSGVTIGKNSVIGANSVVKSDIPDYSVAVGIPASVIKKYDPQKGKWVKVRRKCN